MQLSIIDRLQNLELELQDEELGGLDSDSETENLIYLQSNQGLICDFEENYLKNITLVTTILESDNTAGRTKENSIRLSFVDNEMMLILQKYINHHREEDYIPQPRVYTQVYHQKISRWDRNFLDSLDIYTNSDDKKEKRKRIFNALQYLMYESFFKKLCCKIGNISIDTNEYNDFFNIIESDSEEEKSENSE